MQNVDFYTGKTIRPVQPQNSREDLEYFSRISNFQAKDEHRKFKRASRILSLIVALCIVSFTTGLVIGIKFVSGSDAELVDPQTKEAVNDIGKKVATLIKNNDASSETSLSDLYPKTEYPYLIRLGRLFTEVQSLEIAQYLKSRNYSVPLVMRIKDNIYVGPYKDNSQALNIQKAITSFTPNKDVEIIKR